MLKVTICTLVCMSTVVCNIQAHEIEKRERSHSVRAVVDSIGEIEVKEVDSVDKFVLMFKEAKASGRVRLMYGEYINKKTNTPDTYTTALGGILKYELAELNGFNAGVAFYTSQDIAFITGESSRQYSDFSSDRGNYTKLAESYVNYKYNGFNLRVGRQVIDTPLADSDDIRMIQNTFEAYTATYTLDNFEFMIGNLQRWQGYDAELKEEWVAAGTSGTNFTGVSYKDVFEFNAWYYNITGIADAYYFDGGFEYPVNENITIHSVVQYLRESELDNSAIDTTIYGGLFEVVMYGLGINVAYNKALLSDTKTTFSGFGGGTLFTSMDTLILNDIASDSDTEYLVSGFVYDYDHLSFLYAYGELKNKTDYVAERDIGFEYNVNDEFIVAAIYVIHEDLKNSIKTDADWNRAQLKLNYNF